MSAEAARAGVVKAALRLLEITYLLDCEDDDDEVVALEAELDKAALELVNVDVLVEAAR